MWVNWDQTIQINIVTFSRNLIIFQALSDCICWKWSTEGTKFGKCGGLVWQRKLGVDSNWKLGEVNWGKKSPINILPISLKRLPLVRRRIHFFAFPLELSIILDSSDNWLNNRQWIGHWNPVIRKSFFGQSIMGGIDCEDNWAISQFLSLILALQSGKAFDQRAWPWLWFIHRLFSCSPVILCCGNNQHQIFGSCRKMLLLSMVTNQLYFSHV